MATTKEWDKDPDAILDYTVDWEDWLGTDEISSSEWLVEDGITKDTDTKTTTTATIWLSGGSLGHRYAVTNRIITTGGRKNDDTIFITVKHK